MAQGSAAYNILSNNIGISDSPALDVMDRLRVSTPLYVFDAKFNYDLQPLIFEQITNGTGATVNYDSTNRCANLSFSATATGGLSYMQSYEWLASNEKMFFVTFNFNGGTASVLKFVGVGDNGTNGVQLELSGASTLQITRYSATSLGNSTIAQSSWNLDKLDGTGSSGVTLSLTNINTFVIDFNSSLSNRIRCGFVINGSIIWCHQFNHSNLVANPFFQYAAVPVICGMSCSGTVTSTMKFIAASCLNEENSHNTIGYSFSQEGTATANSTGTHVLSIRPATTFNGVINRTKFKLNDLIVFNTGAYDIKWQLVVGQAITGTNTFSNVNTTYSSMQYNSAGTISGSPTIILCSGYAPVTTSQGLGTKIFDENFMKKFPITLDHTGAVRANGTLSLIAFSENANTTNCSCILNWGEIR